MPVRRGLTRIAAVASLVLASAHPLWADGGTLRLSERAGGYQVSVFTSPQPFRAGPVDVSVLVQDPETGEYVPDARVSVRLTQRLTKVAVETPATTEAATNKLYRAAPFELSTSGWWDVQVHIEGPHGAATVDFAVEADAPLPRWVDLLPWIAWPFVAIALFILHQTLVRRRAGTGTTLRIRGP
jgi:hypothetical protein